MFVRARSVGMKRVYLFEVLSDRSHVNEAAAYPNGCFMARRVVENSQSIANSRRVMRASLVRFTDVSEAFITVGM